MRVLILSLLLTLFSCTNKTDQKQIEHSEYIRHQMLEGNQRRTLDYRHKPSPPRSYAKAFTSDTD
jgi:hypothetical protein